MNVTSEAEIAPSRVHLLSLVTAIAIMLLGTLYPPIMANAAGQADHNLALVLFFSMSAGFVRGVGFVPRMLVWRWLFSGWTCAVALAFAVLLKLWD